ncbi:hypothetical protein GOODEAATRI_011970 [Goodea atripinnis]|uniref:Uncharacterized protein n=1 Tax=Goodea atripinnis TaxID=208336 RepID=A0ABV0PXA7_9TELE
MSLCLQSLFNLTSFSIRERQDQYPVHVLLQDSSASSFPEVIELPSSNLLIAPPAAPPAASLAGSLNPFLWISCLDTTFHHYHSPANPPSTLIIIFPWKKRQG